MLQGVGSCLGLADLEEENQPRDLLRHILQAASRRYRNLLVLRHQSSLQMQTIDLVNTLL